MPSSTNTFTISNAMPAKRLSPEVPPELAALQTRFAAHIRDPDTIPPPENIESRRMKIYAELFFNSISSLLAGTFPVIHELLNESDWERLVRAFYRSGETHTPYFPEIPRDFVRWVAQNNPLTDKPYLPELAHYEWLELAVQIDKSPPPTCQPLPDDVPTLLNGCPQLSPWAQLGSYRYPVHRIKPGFEPRQPDANGHFFIIYRDTGSAEERTRFLAVNPVSALLFAALKDYPDRPLRETLQAIGQQIGHQQSDVMQEAGLEIIRDWYHRGLVAGYRQPTQNNSSITA
jgi:hypothetical protein